MTLRNVGATCVVVAVVAGAPGHAQTVATTYTDSRGKRVDFPLGDASFADEVVAFANGKPGATEGRWSEPALALGVPNYVLRNAERLPPAAVTLGCGGVLVVRFSDNSLVDVPGPDLYVFEAGPAVEPMNLAISTDGEDWVDVGNISGGTAQVDIVNAATAGSAYRYVRLTDLKRGCGGAWPGAEIDAVGAIGSRFDLSFDASVLFDVDQAVLKRQAQAALIDAAKKLAAFAGASITVEGHTDSTGTADRNMNLSQARAEAVRAFLASRPELQGRSLAARGYGANRPVATNSSEVGRQKNRRVEIIVDPPRSPKAPFSQASAGPKIAEQITELRLDLGEALH